MNLQVAMNVHFSACSCELYRTGSKTWHERANMVLIPLVDVKCVDLAPNFGEREHMAWDPLAKLNMMACIAYIPMMSGPHMLVQRENLHEKWWQLGLKPATSSSQARQHAMLATPFQVLTSSKDSKA